jgi:hypothetical protein
VHREDGFWPKVAGLALWAALPTGSFTAGAVLFFGWLGTSYYAVHWIGETTSTSVSNALTWPTVIGTAVLWLWLWHEVRTWALRRRAREEVRRRERVLDRVRAEYENHPPVSLSQRLQEFADTEQGRRGFIAGEHLVFAGDLVMVNDPERPTHGSRGRVYSFSDRVVEIGLITGGHLSVLPKYLILVKRANGEPPGEPIGTPVDGAR